MNNESRETSTTMRSNDVRLRMLIGVHAEDATSSSFDHEGCGGDLEMKLIRIVLPMVLFVLVASLGVRSAVAREHAAKVDKPKTSQKGGRAQGDGAPYPLDTCPVSGEKLGSMGAPVIYNYKGREIKFCCKSCPAKFEANPAKYIAEIDKKIIAKQTGSYPLSTCVVTGEKLGAMGKPIDYVYKNRLVRFCCKSCIEKFNADPAKYLKKIDSAKAKSKS